MIFEVFTHLFKVKSKRRKYTTTTLLNLSSSIKTNLHNQKLEKRMKDVAECSCTRLFNGINHIWSEQINMGNDHVTDSVTPSTDADEIDAIVASEEAMTSITVPPESVDTGYAEDDDDDDSKMPKYATQSAWVEGNKMMKEINYVSVYAAQTARKDRKRTVGRFIVSRVREIQTGNHTVIGEEAVDPLPSPWSTTIQSLNLSYYKK